MDPRRGREALAYVTTLAGPLLLSTSPPAWSGWRSLRSAHVIVICCLALTVRWPTCPRDASSCNVETLGFNASEVAPGERLRRTKLKSLGVKKNNNPFWKKLLKQPWMWIM